MTRAHLARVLSVVAIPMSLACRSRDAPAPAAVVALRGEAARVGGVAIPLALVGSVARSRQEGARRALDDLVSDALLAEEARARGLERAPAVLWASTAALGRLVPERLAGEARARGGPTADELMSLRVIHAVVRRSATVPGARASATAAAIRRAVAPARDDADFESRAREVPHPGLEVTIERVPEFDAAGQSADGAQIDPTFVAAAFDLRTPGQLSEPVETPFGWHVIRLIERIAPNPESVERRKHDLEAAVQTMRVRARLTDLLRAERRRVPVEIAAGAPALMTQAAAEIQ